MQLSFRFARVVKYHNDALLLPNNNDIAQYTIINLRFDIEMEMLH